MLMMTWTHETPCPLCETPVIWTMAAPEYLEVLTELSGDPDKSGWTVDCLCAGCGGNLLVVLNRQEGGLCMELRAGNQQEG